MRQNSLRLARLLTMLPWLQSQGPVSVSEIARVFNITKKEVLADLALLTFVGPDQAGGGLVDIQYDDNEVRVIDSQGLEKSVRLNYFEIFTLLMGLKILQDLDLANSATFSALKKIEEMRGGKPGTSLINSEINKSLSTQQILRIEYLSVGASKAGSREVEPRQILVKNSALYLNAWCRKKKAWREFKVDRILSAVCLAEKFEMRTDLENEKSKAFEVQLDLNRNIRWMLDEFTVRPRIGEGDKLSLKLNVFSAIWLYQFLVSTATSINNLQMPEFLREEIGAELVHSIERLSAS